MTDNYEKLSIAVSDFIVKEIDESLTDHIIEAVKNHHLLTDASILWALTSHIEERVCEEIEDCGKIAEPIIEEKIENHYLDFDDIAREQIERLNLKDMAKEVASEKIDYNLNEEFDLKDLFKEVIEEKIDCIEDTLMPDLSESLCALIEESSKVREAIKKATKEEFKKLLLPVYKNVKSLYFDIFNR